MTRGARDVLARPLRRGPLSLSRVRESGCRPEKTRSPFSPDMSARIAAHRSLCLKNGSGSSTCRVGDGPRGMRRSRQAICRDLVCPAKDPAGPARPGRALRRAGRGPGPRTAGGKPGWVPRARPSEPVGLRLEAVFRPGQLGGLVFMPRWLLHRRRGRASGSRQRPCTAGGTSRKEDDPPETKATPKGPSYQWLPLGPAASAWGFSTRRGAVGLQGERPATFGGNLGQRVKRGRVGSQREGRWGGDGGHVALG